MNRERFEELAQAYGGQIARWPEGERDGAALFAASEPGVAQAALSAASDLDVALEAWTSPAAEAVVREAIVAAAPKSSPPNAFLAWALRAGLGASLAAACAAGVLLGVHLSSQDSGEEAVASVMSSFDLASAEDV